MCYGGTSLNPARATTTSILMDTHERVDAGPKHGLPNDRIEACRRGTMGDVSYTSIVLWVETFRTRPAEGCGALGGANI